MRANLMNLLATTWLRAIFVCPRNFSALLSRELQFLALDGADVTDADHFQTLFVTVLHAEDHVIDHSARQAVQSAVRRWLTVATTS